MGTRVRDPLLLKVNYPWAQLRTTVIHFGLAPAAEREGIQQRSKDDDVECVPLPSIWYRKLRTTSSFHHYKNRTDLQYLKLF